METVIYAKEKNAFQELVKATESELALMGGKAATLASLLQKGFPVPEGAVVFQQPSSSEEFSKILSWWEKSGAFPVAVRSSASGEDSSDFSYAGQFVTLLHISTKTELTEAIKTCFEAVGRKSSQAYAAHFERTDIPMHVLIQRMIDSKFSGVYFSVDPRGENSSWLVEVVEGQGEQLVSGQVNPFRFTENHISNLSPAEQLPSGWNSEYLQQIVRWGQEVEKTFGYKVDMEWAIDPAGNFWILQSRPITAHGSVSNRSKIIKKEWERILSSYPEDSVWDGYTFAEWTGVPTEVTFDLWQKTFQKNHAFDLALKQIGYEGYHEKPDDHGLLDKIFGRAYLNLKSMEPIYFGESPYHLNPYPRPHLEFDWKKLSPALLLRAPLGLFRMGTVAWNIQTGRKELSQKAIELAKGFSAEGINIQDLYNGNNSRGLQESLEQFQNLVDLFSKKYMQGTFLMTLLIESTTQGLLALLEKDLGIEKATQAISHLTGVGLETVATQMQHEYSSAAGSSEKWESFLKIYGHRGMGELELSHPRWIESHPPAFKTLKGAVHQSIDFVESKKDPVMVDLISHLSAIRKPVFEQELTELQHLMQIREEIKMEVMKPYAQIRWLLINIGKQTGLEQDIFWLNVEEILSLKVGLDSKMNALRSTAEHRRQQGQHLKSIDLPMVFSKQQLKTDIETILNENSKPVETNDLTKHVLGVSLSPGLASGVVHIVTNPEEEDLDTWPDNYVLVAEATDPGWTPLFERAQAVIVARGGVLSHCAIVAREMNLPAVGEVRKASYLFKEGERVWVDGNSGTIRRSH
ncbi:MAG: PEP/pyruvate-binding domain-containing protein [Bdellovibrio sp.]